MTAGVAAGTPARFRRAVASLSAARLRPGVQLAEMPAPARVAPWTHALSVVLVDGEQDAATGRFVLLHDPAGVDAWDGDLRVVIFASVEISEDMASDSDQMLATAAWSWLTDALQAGRCPYRALGGTVTATTSTRFGDIVGPPRTIEVELRASWTPDDPDLSPHLAAFGNALASAAGWPPEGVAALPARRHPIATH